MNSEWLVMAQVAAGVCGLEPDYLADVVMGLEAPSQATARKLTAEIGGPSEIWLDRKMIKQRRKAVLDFL